MTVKTPHVDSFGTQWWFNKSNKLHNYTGPAVIYKEGWRQWWVDGKHLDQIVFRFKHT